MTSNDEQNVVWPNDNLPPNSKKWSRLVQKSLEAIYTKIDKLVLDTNKSVKALGINLGTITRLVDKLSVQQGIISAEQQMQAINTSHQIIDFPDRTTVGSSSITVPITLPSSEEYDGIVTFTMVPNPAVGGSGGASVNGELSTVLRTIPGVNDIAISGLPFYADSLQSSSQDTSISILLDDYVGPTSVTLSSAFISSAGTGAKSITGYLLITYNLKKKEELI